MPAPAKMPCSRADFIRQCNLAEPEFSPQRSETIRFQCGLSFVVRPDGRGGATVYSSDLLPSTNAPLVAQLLPMEYAAYRRMCFDDRRRLMAVLVAEASSAPTKATAGDWATAAAIRPLPTTNKSN